MAIKKNEIYSSLWASCDKLRGGMDASQYKAAVILPHGVLFRGNAEATIHKSIIDKS